MKMAVKINQKPGTGQQNLTRSLEKILEEAHCSGELSLSNRKLKDFPKPTKEYNLSDTIIADLSRNRFCELPEEVTDFSFLETLLLYHNGIRSISPSIKSLTSLTYLDLRSNQLTSLPREVCFLPLQVLLVSNNRLTSLPDDLGRMERLTDLDASYNQLSTLPARIGDLRSLRSFSLRSNQLMYLPRELTYLSLVSLDVSGNRISSLPTELRQMTTLTEFNLEHNPMTSPPASLCVRGLVHVFKFLETQATKDERGKSGGNYDGYTTLRRTNRTHSANVADTTAKPNRQNSEFNYNITDNVDKRWSSDVPPASKTRTEIPLTTPKPIENFHLDLSNPLSPSKQSRKDGSNSDVSTRTETPTFTNSNSSTGSGASFSSSSPEDDLLLDMPKGEDKNTNLENIQTYREYKEALKQQRNHDVYKPKNNQSKHIFEINENVNNLPDDGNSENILVTNGNSKNVFQNEDSIIVIPKKPVQKVIPSRNVEVLCKDEKPKTNGDSSSGGYVKPSSPMKSANSGGTNGILTTTNNKFSLPNSNKSVGKSSSKTRSVTWNHDIPPEKLSFTMRREFDKHKEEAELITQLRSIIENRLKMSLPEDIASALTDGVILCHLANYVRPRSVASIHVPTPGVTKLTMARCRRNVDNFLEACRKIGVDEELICSCEDVLPDNAEAGEYIEGRNVQNPSAVYRTVRALLDRTHQAEKDENDKGDQQMSYPATNNNSTQHPQGPPATSILKVNNLNLPSNSNKFKLLDQMMPNNNLNTNLNNVKKVVTKRIEFFEDYGIGAGATPNKSNNIYSIYNPITTSTTTEKLDGSKSQKFLPLNGCCKNISKTQDSNTLTYVLSGIFIFTFLFLFFFPIPN